MSTELNPRQRQAAELLARGDMTKQSVAAQLGARPESISRWQLLPAFKAHYETARAEIEAAVRAEGIANRQNRINALNERQQLMAQVIAARAEANARRALKMDTGDLTFEDYAAAGAETGLMVHTVTYLKDGRREEWAVDTGLLKEMREHEKQAAQDLGQWTEKRELSGDPDKPLNLKHATTFNYDTYTGLLAEVLGAGTGRLPAASGDGGPEQMDSPSSD